MRKKTCSGKKTLESSKQNDRCTADQGDGHLGHLKISSVTFVGEPDY